MTALIEALDDVFTPKLPQSPYPGLRPFQKNEWPIFFGRERMTDDVINLLLKKRMLLVHGTSGNGKSSLIRAGVLPRLEQEHARSGIMWHTCASTPGKNPIGNLAQALATLTIETRREPTEFRRALNRGKQSAKAISDLLALNVRNRLCVLIDQFEEVFHQPGDAENDRANLLSDFLVGFRENPPDGLFVLLTMRSEFLGHCSQFGLAEAMNDAQYLLPRMDTDNLIRAVREPARLFGGGVTERLAERLIIDARKSQDELPLIQHGLARLWEGALNSGKGDGPVIDLDDYKAAESLASMISVHADKIAETVAEDTIGEKIVEGLFRSLTAINAEGYAIRRSQRFDQLVAITGTTDERLRRILEAFRRPGVSFITPYPPVELERDTKIEISHESLIRNWKKIADRSTGWLQKEFRDGLTWQALRVQAESFSANPANLLSEATTETRSIWLRERNEPWAGRYGGMWLEVNELMEASRRDVQRRKSEAVEQKEEADGLKAQVERSARLRTYSAVAVILSLIMGALSTFAGFAWQKAEREKEVAEAATARLQDALKLATDATNHASKLQDESAASYVSSHGGGNRGTLIQTLSSLEKETDPVKIAFLGQIVSELVKHANDTEIHSVLQVLIRAYDRADEPSSTNAIAQALSNIAANLPNDQAQREADSLLKSMSVGSSPRRAESVALIFGAIAPKVNQSTATEMSVYLVNSLSTTGDPQLMSAIAVALSTLKWVPSIAESERLLGGVLKTLNITTNPAQIANISTILTAMAPIMSPKSAQSALESIKSMAPQAVEVLKPATAALSTRLQHGSNPPAQNPSPQSLFQRMSANRWCTPSRSYSMQLSGGTVIWRDNLGSIDIESISSNGLTDAQTATQKSFHPDGKSEDIGTTWNYHLSSPDRITVKSSSKSFLLSRC